MIHGDVCDILINANVASGRVFPQFADVDESAKDYVVVLRNGYEPIRGSDGTNWGVTSTFLFACMATQKGDAGLIAAAVRAALDADHTIKKRIETPDIQEDSFPEVMEQMEPVQYAFIHTE